MKDYRSLLKAAMAKAQSAEPGLSLSEIAKRASMSRSLLSLILNQKRNLTLEVAGSLARALELDQIEREKLLLMVQIESTDSQAHRLGLERELASIYEHQNPMQLELPKTLADDPELRWLAYLIFATKTMPWSGLDAKNLSKIVSNSEEQINFVLAELRAAGFLRQNPNGDFLIKDFRRFGQRHLIKELLQNTLKSYDCEGENDLYSAVSFPISAENIERAEFLTKEFVRQMMDLRHSQGKEDGREVYQLVVAFHNILPSRPGKLF